MFDNNILIVCDYIRDGCVESHITTGYGPNSNSKHVDLRMISTKLDTVLMELWFSITEYATSFEK